MKAQLPCPHCEGTMNSLGPGPDRRSTRYICLGCTKPLRVKELWQGQVVRTGAQDFGFVAIEAMPFLGDVHFKLEDVHHTEQVRIGDRVAVLIEDGPEGKFARALYPVAARPTSRRRSGNGRTEDGRGSAGRNSGNIDAPRTDQRSHSPRHRSRDDSRSRARRWGEVKVLKAVDWGFITDLDSGDDFFFHASNCRGPVMRQGQRVIYTPVRTAKGLSAEDVVPA